MNNIGIKEVKMLMMRVCIKKIRKNLAEHKILFNFILSIWKYYKKQHYLLTI